MRRSIYRALIALHPPAFRRRFTGELLWVFDQAAMKDGASGACADAASSLLRQWLCRPAVWIITGGFVGAILTVSWSSAISRFPRPSPRTAAAAPEVFLLVTAATFLAVAFTLVLAVLSFQTLRRRRS